MIKVTVNFKCDCHVTHSFQHTHTNRQSNNCHSVDDVQYTYNVHVKSTNGAGASPEDYQRLSEALQEHIGELNGCIHSAAHFEGLTPLQQLPATQWWLGLQANLSAPFLLYRVLIPLLTTRNGRLLFILDDMNLTAKAFWGTYGVAQWGLRALITQWSEELSNLPIQLNGIELPPFRTGLRGKAYPAEDPATLIDPEQLANQLYSLLQSQVDIPLISNLQEALS